jgi:hypothetical protein
MSVFRVFYKHYDHTTKSLKIVELKSPYQVRCIKKEILKLISNHWTFLESSAAQIPTHIVRF